MSSRPKYLNIHDLETSGKILASSLYLSKKLVRPEITPIEIDFSVEMLITGCGAVPSFKHYLPEGSDKPYPATTCISVNNQVVHSIPTEIPLKCGDVVTVDIGVSYNLHHTDAARTFIVGEDINRDIEKINLIVATRKALNAGIGKAVVGNRIGNVSNAIQKILHKYK